MIQDWKCLEYREGVEINGYCSLLEMASGSLKVGRLSAPLLEYSLHLRAAAAARAALSFTSSSATQPN